MYILTYVHFEGRRVRVVLRSLHGARQRGQNWPAVRLPAVSQAQSRSFNRAAAARDY